MPPMSLKMNVMKPLVQGAWRETRAIKLKLQSTKQLITKSIKGHNEQMKKVCTNITNNTATVTITCCVFISSLKLWNFFCKVIG